MLTAPPPPPRRAVLVVVDHMRRSDARWVFHEGAAAWMNVRTAGGGGAYATLGAGTRLRGPDPPVHPSQTVDVAALATRERTLPYAVDVGALGTAVRRAGGCTAAFGGPGAVVAAMDDRGRVSRRSLAPARPDELSGVRCPLVVFEVPDARARRFLAGLRLRPSDLLVVVGVGDHQLLPAAIRGLGRGLATSPTTREHGLVANTDVAPTILRYLGLPPDRAAVGHAITVVPGRVAAALRLGAVDHANDRRRPWVFRGYVYVETLLVFLATVAIVRRRGSPWLRVAVRSMAAVPLGFLSLALVPLSGPLAAAVVTAAAALLAAWLFRDVLGLSLATVAFLCFDLARGAPWMIASPLGYSFSAGARYYGIGDEYEGVLVGAALAAAGLAYDRLHGRGRLAGLVAGLAGVALLVGWPGLGTNFGGLLACGAGTIVLWAALRRPGRAALAAAGAVLTALLAGSGIYDAWHAGTSATHLGETALLVQHMGPMALWPIAERKLEMNWRLIHYTPWSGVLLVSIGCFALLVYRPRGAYRRATAGRPGTSAGLMGIAAATLANLAGQDAGVVAAAMNMVFGSALLLDLLLAAAPPEGSRDAAAAPREPD